MFTLFDFWGVGTWLRPEFNSKVCLITGRNSGDIVRIRASRYLKEGASHMIKLCMKLKLACVTLSVAKLDLRSVSHFMRVAYSFHIHVIGGKGKMG